MTRIPSPRRTVLSLCLLTALAACGTASAAVIDDDVDISGHYIQVRLSPDDGGTIHSMRLLTGAENLVGPAGILLEGFGVPSRYLPNRRVNEKLEALEEHADRPVLRFSYDCEGPNIQGLHVTRIMEPLPDEASMRVTWLVENRGKEDQWIAPWIGNDLLPGGDVSPEDRIDLTSDAGVIRAERTAWHSATRNWIAATAPAAQESLFAVFDADQIYAFLTLWDENSVGRGVQAAFAPKFLKPGETWKTVYRIGVTRGLRRVDFATDDLAVELQYSPGTLIALIAAVKPLSGVQIDARVVAENGRVWKLPAKKFDIEPGKVIRCTYPWDAPADGHYEFMARLIKDGVTLPLGAETGSPHGGIDTRFTVGKPAPRPMEAWTDAPHAMDRGPRTLDRTPAFAGEPLVWVAPALEKVFREDRVRPAGTPSPLARISLARGEREAFQICFRPEKEPLLSLTVEPGDLVHEGGGARIPASDISVADVRWMPVRIPSHFEGPTGLWPDALPPHRPFVADRGLTSAVWVTVHARRGLPAGLYRGKVALRALDEEPRELNVEVRVHDFDLPDTPRLKTDFGFWDEAAVRGAKALGGRGDAAALTQAYLDNALEHRVTLREAMALPEPGAGDYGAALAARLPALRRALEKGATTIAAPPSLLAAPEKLAALDAFVRREGLGGRVFTPMAYEPPEPAWPGLMDSLAKWRAGAPNVPSSVSTIGLHPFLPDDVDLWCVHAQLMDTQAGLELLRRISAGREVWWYVSHTPPRPYGNLFVDFAAVEHRILFWQAWALGMRGMQYWSVNYFPEWQNPHTDLLDSTPVNGDGCLVYPGPDGPVNSIRWETVRDGIEDYDYLSLFMERRNALLERGGHQELLQRAASAYNLENVVPSLVTFSRDGEVLARKRAEIATMIEEMDRALKTAPPPSAPAPASTPAPTPALAPSEPFPVRQFPASEGPRKNFGGRGE